MSNVLVTGGSGFIGSALVKRLVNEGHSVKVFDNNSRGSKAKLGDYINEVDFIEGDIRNADEVDKACNNIDILFHLAFINGTRFFYEIPERVLEVGVKGAVNTLDAAVNNNIGKYILASSSEVYQQPIIIPTPETERIIIPDITNPRYSYSGGKIISELLAVNYARKGPLEAMIFRPHNIYGPDMGYEHVIPEFICRMKTLSADFSKKSIDFPIQGTGSETRAFCYIDDFVDGLMLVMNNGRSGEIYHIGNDKEEIDIRSLAEKIAGLLDIKLLMTHTELQKGGTLRRCPSIEKMRGLGYEPRISLEDGLSRTISWYLTHCDVK